MHPKVLTLAHASSHMSTIHTCVSSRPRLHSHTPGHPQHTARSQNPQVRTHYRCMRFTFSRAGLSRSNFLTLTSHAHSRGHTRHSFPVTFVHTQEGPPMSAPRPGPSGLRQNRPGAATSQGVSHGPQGAGWDAVRVNGCWVSRIVPGPHGAHLATPDHCHLPCSAGTPWWRRRQ